MRAVDDPGLAGGLALQHGLEVAGVVYCNASVRRSVDGLEGRRPSLAASAMGLRLITSSPMTHIQKSAAGTAMSGSPPVAPPRPQLFRDLTTRSRRAACAAWLRAGA
jgi:hypothetical protein